MVGSTRHLSITNDKITIMCDIITKTQRDPLFCANMQRTDECGIATMEGSKDAVHRLLGHLNAEKTVKSAHNLG